MPTEIVTLDTGIVTLDTGIVVNPIPPQPMFYQIDKEALLIGSIIKEREYIKRNNLDYHISYFCDGSQNRDFTIAGKEGTIIFRYLRTDNYDNHSIHSMVIYFNTRGFTPPTYKWWCMCLDEHGAPEGAFVNSLKECYKGKIWDLYV